MPRLFTILVLLSFSSLAQAQGMPPAPPMWGGYPPRPSQPPPPQQGDFGAGQQGYGGCYGCSYTGDYYGSNVTARRPAPPLRLQGQWRNGWWYY